MELLVLCTKCGGVFPDSQCNYFTDRCDGCVPDKIDEERLSQMEHDSEMVPDDLLEVYVA